MKHINQIWNTIPTSWHSIITALLIFIVFWVIAMIVSRLINRLNIKKHQAILDFVQQCVRNFILLIGLVSALGTAGINVTALVASLGLASFAAGYALKDTLGNIIAGFMIILNGSFKPGQHIAIDNYEGIVEAVRLRYTVLRQENKCYYVPNGTFTNSTLTIFD